MSTQPHILDLPRELRDMIYDEFLGTGGYVFDHETCKLAMPDGTAIDLGLRLTCRQIAAEMKESAFRNKSVIFKTIYSAKKRAVAGRFGETVYLQRMAEAGLLDTLRDYVTDKIQDEILYWYPHYRRPLNEFLRQGTCTNFMARRWAEAPSMQSAFIQYVLCLLAAQPELAGYPVSVKVLESLRSVGNGARLDEFISPEFQPWTVPTEQHLDEFWIAGTSKRNWEYRNRGIFRFSAAAAASHFLARISDEARAQFRKITLVEDHPSVAHPQCHAQGLIPFCQENPNLRIERRVNLWTTIFQCGYWDRRKPLYAKLNPEWSIKYGLETTEINECIASWIVEANVLLASGMPETSFTLVLDGYPIPEKSCEAFKVVRHFAGRQILLERRSERAHPLSAPSFIALRRSASFVYEGFPQAVEDIISGRSIVKCNFPTGESWLTGNTEKERYTSLQRGVEQMQIPLQFCTDPPLPAWSELLKENVLPLP